MKCFFALFLFFISCFAFGQTKEIDSLKKLLSNSIIDKNQAELNLSISKLIENKNRDSSKVYAKNAENIAINIKDKDLLRKALLQQGILFYKQQKDEIALTFFNKIDSLYKIEKVINEQYIMTKIYRAEISKFSFTMPGVLKAKEYLKEAIKLSEEIRDEKLINLTKFRMGEWHGFMSQAENTKQHLDTATTYLNNALKYYQKENNYEFVARVYYSMASADVSKKDFEAAELNYKRRLEAIKKTNDSVKIGEAYYGLGSIFRKFKQPDIGLKYLDSAASIFKKHGFSTEDRRKNLYKDYAYLYELKSDFKNAYFNMQKALVLKDTLYKEENIKMTLELETKYQTEKKEQEITLLTSQNQLAEQQKKSQRNLFLAGLGFTTIAGLFLFVMYQNRQKTNTKLKELDKVKSNFFANISHEFRTPLTLIADPINDALDDNALSNKKRQQFTVAKQNSDRLLSLVNQLLDLSKIDAGQLKLHIQNDNVLKLIAALSESFSYSAKQKNISYLVTIKQTEENVWFDKDAVEKTVVNLLSNAIKYTPKNGSIMCNAKTDNGKLYIEIKNTGKGLTTDQVSNIFQRFYQTNEQNQGTGIGLALVKELVELHKGSIVVNSEPNAWTTFTVTLPVDKNSFKKEQFVNTASTAPITKTPFTSHTTNKATEEFTDSELPILLVVEDHADLRTLLKQTFETTYNVMTAPNGAIGVELALEHIPDLIISDIMMPEKDGITLTKELKTDERASHIPIILLTAKAEAESQFEGIEIGADDYITKPFDKKLLKLKVEKLIESRNKLQLRYSQEVILKPKDIAISNIDEKFLEKVQAALDQNLVESSFSIEDFSKAVGLSRMQLHRKIKALTGLSASEFIRSQRLKLAAQLLKKSDINISQVGYTVGFNDHSYFTKCFKEAYNCTPTEYSKLHA